MLHASTLTHPLLCDVANKITLHFGNKQWLAYGTRKIFNQFTGYPVTVTWNTCSVHFPENLDKYPVNRIQWNPFCVAAHDRIGVHLAVVGGRKPVSVDGFAKFGGIQF